RLRDHRASAPGWFPQPGPAPPPTARPVRPSYSSPERPMGLSSFTPLEVVPRRGAIRHTDRLILRSTAVDIKCASSHGIGAFRQLAQPALDEATFRVLLGQGQRRAVGVLPLGGAADPTAQAGARGVREM